MQSQHYWYPKICKYNRQLSALFSSNHMFANLVEYNIALIMGSSILQLYIKFWFDRLTATELYQGANGTSKRNWKDALWRQIFYASDWCRNKKTQSTYFYFCNAAAFLPEQILYFLWITSEFCLPEIICVLNKF